MIVPSGKRRQQIAQGQRPYESVWDCLDDVTAQVDPKAFKLPGGESDDPQQNKDVANALQQGNAPGMSGRFNEPGGRAPGDRAPKPEMGAGREMGVAPGMGAGLGDEVGNEVDNGNRWLQPDGTQEEVDPTGVLQETDALEQAAGRGFENRISVKKSSDGFEATIAMPEGYTIPQTTQFAQALMQAVNGTLSYFDPGQGKGMIKLVYTSGMGQQKIEKAKNSKR